MPWSWPPWTCQFGFFGQMWETVSLNTSAAPPSCFCSPGTLVAERESVYWSPACPWSSLPCLFYSCYSDWVLHRLSSHSPTASICPFCCATEPAHWAFHFILSCYIFLPSNFHLDFLYIFFFSGEIFYSLICAHCSQLLVEALSWMLPEHPRQVIPASVSSRCRCLSSAFSHSSWDFPGSRCNTGSSIPLNIRVCSWLDLYNSLLFQLASPTPRWGQGAAPCYCHVGAGLTRPPSCWAEEVSFTRLGQLWNRCELQFPLYPPLTAGSGRVPVTKNRDERPGCPPSLLWPQPEQGWGLPHYIQVKV